MIFPARFAACYTLWPNYLPVTVNAVGHGIAFTYERPL